MKEETKKNLILIIPNLGFGGAQKSFWLLSIKLSEKYNVVNVVFNREELSPYSFTAPLVSLDIPASGNPLFKLINFFKRINRLKKIKREFQAEVSISFLEGADYVNILSRQNDKVILSIRGSKRYDLHIRGFIGWFRHHLFIPLLYNRADRVVAINQGVKEELDQYYKLSVPVQVVYNALDNTHLHHSLTESFEKEWEEIFKEPVIVSHGRLSSEKGYDNFLKVMIALKHRGIKCTLLLIGDGPEYTRLVNLGRSFQLKVWDAREMKTLSPDADVYFSGYLKNPFTFLLRSKIFILPSLHEGFSHSIGEAMICGLPIVATDCPYSPREILAPDTQFRKVRSMTNTEWCEYGVLVPEWSTPLAVEAWAETITRLLTYEEKWEHYSRQSKKRAADFSIEKNITQWMGIIEG